MTNVFIGETLPNIRPLPILNRQLGKKPYTGKKAYRAVFDEMDFSFIKAVDDPRDADFFLIPHHFFSIKDKKYIDNFLAQAKKYNKKVLIFAYGDNESNIVLSGAIMFRSARYRYQKKKKNESYFKVRYSKQRNLSYVDRKNQKTLERDEIIMPAQIYAGDILKDKYAVTRDKKEVPVVSFCGWAGFSSPKERLRNFLKIFPLDVKKYVLFDKHVETHKQGVYWRKKAIRALSRSSFIQTSFLIRNFYAANKYTVQGDPAVLRAEYIENMAHSDFVLAPRGDGNYSVRFYEALVLGRIPVLIDTDCVLPLEDEIDYKKFVVFVPYADIKNTYKYIRDFWDNLSDEEYKKRQKLARETFMKYLKFDSFLKHMFEHKLKS